MKYIIILIIKLYYKVVPEDNRRVCIHAESCSKYVLRITKKRGFIRGLMAYIDRKKSCNPNYTVETSTNMIIKIKTQNGIVLNESEINPFIIHSLKLIY